MIGNYGIKKRCSKCEGAGCIPKQLCKDCEGLGVQRQLLKETIELPQGLRDGQKLKVPQMGHASDVYTSVAGDLLIHLKVKPHEFFTRDDTTIKSEVELTMTEAILGATITISTVHGPLNIKVEPGVCSGDTMVLKHYGVPEFEPPDHYDEV